MFSSNTTTPRRPRVASTQSFSRLDSPADSPPSESRTRANTIHTPTITSVPEAKRLPLTPEDGNVPNAGDIFESSDLAGEDGEDELDTDLKDQRDGAIQLPIEIQSFLERYMFRVLRMTCID